MSRNLSFRVLTNIDEKHFQASKDYFMKLVEEDLKLIAWIAWGMDYLFTDYSYEQMFEFIGAVTDADLKGEIEFVEYDISTVNTKSDVVFDRHFSLSENGTVFRYLNVENQFKVSPYEELQARGIVYVSSNLYWQKTHRVINYDEVVPASGLWIFPNSPKYRKNTMSYLPCPLPLKVENRKPVSGGDLQEVETVQPDFQLKMEVAQYYLGDPLEITGDMLVKDSNAKENKQNYLLLLLDTMFGFHVEKQTRLDIAEKIFNLKGLTLDKEVNTMEILQDTVLGEAYEKGFKDASNAFADYLIKESGGALTWKEALEKVEKILASKGSNTPPATS